MSELSEARHDLLTERAANKRLRSTLAEERETIRRLRMTLDLAVGAAGLIPPSYAMELVALAHVALNGSKSSERVQIRRAEPNSTPPPHDSAAYRRLYRQEITHLEARAGLIEAWLNNERQYAS